MDVQSLTEALGGLDEESVVSVFTTVLSSRPEIAPLIVAYACPELSYPSAKVLMDRRSQGVVKSYNPEKGFGFIECPELHEVFGNDVFLHCKQISGFAKGDSVSFAVALNKDNKPQAYDLQSLNGGHPIQHHGQNQYNQNNHYSQQGQYNQYQTSAPIPHNWPIPPRSVIQPIMKREPVVSTVSPSSSMPRTAVKRKQAVISGKADEQHDLGEHVGFVKSFNAKNGYGFIECDALKEQGFQNDVFLHHLQLGSFDVGSVVRFSAYLNSKGQPQAKELEAEASAKRTKIE